MAAKKVQAIRDFLAGMIELRRSVKDDCTVMMNALTLKDVADEETLAAFLTEMVETAARRHLIDQRGKVAPRAAGMIRQYVRGMVK